MLATELIKSIEKKVPPYLALKDDKIGYFGRENPDELEINKVHVLLDIMPHYKPSQVGADLTICHHPPIILPEFPVYVIHSNWDVIKGGANDALAESLNLEVVEDLDKKTGIGRICTTSITIKDFIKRIASSLPVHHINMINSPPKKKIEKVGLVAGFGLKNPEYVKLAHDNQVDLLLSGDINHKTALIAGNLGLSILDATHYATEIPGLIKLCNLVSNLGVETELIHSDVPWNTVKL